MQHTVICSLNILRVVLQFKGDPVERNSMQAREGGCRKTGLNVKNNIGVKVKECSDTLVFMEFSIFKRGVPKQL